MICIDTINRYIGGIHRAGDVKEDWDAFMEFIKKEEREKPLMATDGGCGSPLP